VVGYVYTAGGHTNAYVSSNGTATSLHQGDPNTGNSKAGASTRAVRWSARQASATRRKRGVFEWHGADPGHPGRANSYGYGINASGQVVGVSDTVSGSQHGFVTGMNGALVDIGPVNGGYGSSANAINGSAP
jgi:probable HAF family extracellular repeat protein